jgi:regulator of cell morphogenesis and NO signaling
MSKEPDLTAIARQLQSMQDEHLVVAKLLERIRAASDEFTLPEWACNSYNTLFSELKQIESDVFTHVHLENHVLKPRFAA